MKLKYLKSDYIPKGCLKDFPLEVIDKMVERQVEQGNEHDVKIFEDRVDGGFTWSYTEEGNEFWRNVIMDENFDLFFKKYPKEKELPLPRVIEVKFSDEDRWKKRVVIAFKNNKALCWDIAETIEDAENRWAAMLWEQWREIGEESKIEYKPFDFSDGVENYSHLIDKIIVYKKQNKMFKVSELFCSEIEKRSFINSFGCEYLFKHCTFEDGSPVGIKIEN